MAHRSGLDDAADSRSIDVFAGSGGVDGSAFVSPLVDLLLITSATVLVLGVVGAVIV